ncbi:MAG: hypothetical protein CMO72_01175 [Verrucomicrobiales bacterium]|nr:hypothetical protein [Verrucomicrobiales bacterium]
MATRQNLYFIMIASWAFAGLACKPPGAKALFNGEKLLQKGNAEAAIIEFEKAVQILPEEWRAWNYLGLARHRADDLNGASEAFQKSVKIAGERGNSPDHPSFVLYFNQGRLNLDRGRLADAQRQLHTFASQKQTFKSLFWLAEAFRQNGDMLQAQKTYRLALDENNSSPVVHNRHGLVQLKLKNYSGAITSFRQALELQPEFNHAQLNLALTYHLHVPADYPNRETLAFEAFKTYIKNNPEPAVGVQKMMDALEVKLDPTAASSASLENTNNELVEVSTNQFAAVSPDAVGLDSDVGLPLTNRFSALPTTENNAVTTVTEESSAVKIDRPSLLEEREDLPSSAELIPPVAVSETGGGQATSSSLPEQSMPIVVPEISGVARYKYIKPQRPKPVAVENPKRLDSMFNQAFHLYQIKEFDKAITGYRGLLEINPAHQQAHVNIAITMQVKGDVKASLSAYEKALAINPFSQPAREGFASALNQSGFFIDAAVEFHKLLKVHRDNVPAHLGLGVLYAQHLNQPDKAEYYYRRVLELNPQHSEAANIRRWLYNKSQ